MKREITIVHESGQQALVMESSLPVWEERGWSVVDEGVDEPTAQHLAAPEELRGRAARTQSSDVTAPGESKVEGTLPTRPKE